MILKDKIALVTGSSRGIGAATAKLLAEQGARVAVNYVNACDLGEGVVQEIERNNGEAMLICADVRDTGAINTMVQNIKETWGPVDILVNNANMSFPVQPFVEYSWEDFQNKLNSELIASFHTCKAVVPDMIERKSGCIVNVSSGLSRYPGPGFIAHSSAKAALDAFSRGLASELGQYGITVNVIAPGLTLTDATAFQPEEIKQAIVHQTPLGRLADPEDVAGAILMFCSEWARFLTGTYVPVSGGLQMV